MLNAAVDSDIEEYTYARNSSHLTESQALNKYRSVMRCKHPDTLVILEDHDCGHWTITELKTPAERQTYFQRLYQTFITQLLGAVRAR